MNQAQEEHAMERLIGCLRGGMAHDAAEIVNGVNRDVAGYSRMGTHLDDKVVTATKVT